MRVFAVSDVHLEYDENGRWLSGLSHSDYRDDILILAGDVAEDMQLLRVGFQSLTSRFRRVVYVPGNHELWLTPDCGVTTSLDKLARVCRLAADHRIAMAPFQEEALSIVPLFGWYDYTFGAPSAELEARWLDFLACKWPAGFGPGEITEHFLAMNVSALYPREGTVISFSHFLPRIDVMPREVPVEHQMLYPVLGTTRLEEQIRRLQPAIHIYGHSHVSRTVTLDGRTYINNALGYPKERRHAAQGLLCIDIDQRGLF
jgi:Icc-related predicted phosphoesterase